MSVLLLWLTLGVVLVYEDKFDGAALAVHLYELAALLSVEHKRVAGCVERVAAVHLVGILALLAEGVVELSEGCVVGVDNG